MISYFLDASNFALKPIRKNLIESSFGSLVLRFQLFRCTPASERIRKKLLWRLLFTSHDQLRAEADQEKPDREQLAQPRPWLSASLKHAGAWTNQE